MSLLKCRAALVLVTFIALAGCGASATSGSTAPTATPTSTPTLTASSTATTTATPPPAPSGPASVFLGVGANVFGLNPQTGAKAWTHPVPVNSYGGTGLTALALSGSTVLETDESGNAMYAFSARDGSMQWKASGIQGDHIAAANGAAIAYGTSSQTPSSVLAVNIQTGAILWKQTTWATDILSSGNAAYESRLLPGSDTQPITNGYLQALDIHTGAVLWKQTGHPYDHLALVGTTLYVTSGNALDAYSAATGTLLWSQSFTNSYRSGQFITLDQDGSTLLVTNGQTLYAVNASAHQVLWHAPLTSYLSVTTTGNTVCAAVETLPSYQPAPSGTMLPRGIYGFNVATGQKLWFHAGAYSFDTAQDGMCLADGAQGNTPLTALDASTGATRWTANIPTENLAAAGAIPSSQIAAINGTLYVISQTAYRGTALLYAISESHGTTLWHLNTGVAGPAVITVASS